MNPIVDLNTGDVRCDKCGEVIAPFPAVYDWPERVAEAAMLDHERTCPSSPLKKVRVRASMLPEEVWERATHHDGLDPEAPMVLGVDPRPGEQEPAVVIAQRLPDGRTLFM